MGIGDWGLGIGDWGFGDWGLGEGPNLKSQIPKPPPQQHTPLNIKY